MFFFCSFLVTFSNILVNENVMEMDELDLIMNNEFRKDMNSFNHPRMRPQKNCLRKRRELFCKFCKIKYKF